MNEFLRYQRINWGKFCDFFSRHLTKLHRFTKHVVEAGPGMFRLSCGSGRADEDDHDVEAGIELARTSNAKDDEETYHTTAEVPAPVPDTTPFSLAEGAESTPGQSSNGKLLWKNAIRTMKLHNNLDAGGSADSSTPFNLGGAGVRGGGEADGSTPRPIPIRKGTGSSAIGAGPDHIATPIVGRRGMSLSGGPGPLSTVKSRLSALVPKLFALEATQDLPAHDALVRHIQFSPDGKYLATSSWDRTSVIFKVGDPFVSHRVLAHPQGFASQVAW